MRQFRRPEDAAYHFIAGFPGVALGMAVNNGGDLATAAYVALASKDRHRLLSGDRYWHHHRDRPADQWAREAIARIRVKGG